MRCAVRLHDTSVNTISHTLTPEAIFNWFARGPAWRTEGLKAPTGVQAATAEHGDVSAALSDFLAEHCLVASGVSSGGPNCSPPT